MVKALPNTSFLPVPKSAPAGHTTAAAHLLWQVFPRYPCLEYKDNSGQSCPVRYTWTGLLWAWAYVLAKAVQSDSTVRRLPASWAFASPPLVFYCLFLYLSGFVRCSYPLIVSTFTVYNIVYIKPKLSIQFQRIAYFILDCFFVLYFFEICSINMATVLPA